MDILDRMAKRHEVIIDTTENGNRIYTFFKEFFVKCSVNYNVEFAYRMGITDNFGFVRLLCDNKGNLLAYTCARPIVPDPFKSQFHRGQWYAFESYNRELIKDFEIIARDMYGDPAKWEYSSDDNKYKLTIPTAWGNINHWYSVQDDKVTSNYGLKNNGTKTYNFNGNLKKPNPDIVKFLNTYLIREGIKTKRQVFCENLKNKIKAFSK